MLEPELSIVRANYSNIYLNQDYLMSRLPYVKESSTF